MGTAQPKMSLAAGLRSEWKTADDLRLSAPVRSGDLTNVVNWASIMDVGPSRNSSTVNRAPGTRRRWVLRFAEVAVIYDRRVDRC